MSQGKSQKAEISDASGAPKLSGHSPTPWTYESVLSFGEHAIISEAMEIALAFSSDGLDEPTAIPAKANAAFIVRAVNDYEALRSSLKEMLDCYWGEGDGHPAPEFIQCAQALVAASREVRS